MLTLPEQPSSIVQQGCDFCQRLTVATVVVINYNIIDKYSHNNTMSIEEFLGLSLRRLESITSIDKSNWSKYFNDHLSPNWNTICKASESLGMEPYELMEAISLKRKKSLRNIAV